jgi:hypothetical protein
MTSSELPADLRRFILTSIPSVPFLEAVLLLRADPGHSWGASQLARRLYVPEQAGAELVQLLRSSGIATDAEPAGCIRYGPDEALASLVDGLAAAYAQDLVAVTRLIHSRIDRRAQQFADAFRFRKE